MKAEDVRAMTADQLQEELLKLKREQLNLRFQKASGQLEKVGRIRQVRRDIARVLTGLSVLRKQNGKQNGSAASAATKDGQK